MTEDRNGPQLKSLRAGVSKFRKSICLTVKWHLQWSQTGWLSLDRRYEWVTRLWPILWRVMTVSSQRHNDARGLFLSSTGLTKNNSLLVGVLSNESCHSSIHSLDICGKKLSGRIFHWVITKQISYNRQHEGLEGVISWTSLGRLCRP